MQDWQDNRERERRFEAYAEALAAAVEHADRREPLACYLAGLLTVEGRKSVEPMAAAVAADDKSVSARRQSMTHFVGKATWSDTAMMDVGFRQALAPVLSHGPILAWCLDDTGNPKKGTHSVGVARQYCGNRGKVESCQVAVSLSLVNEYASIPVGYRLYLPKAWAEDAQARAKVGVPPEVEFQTKPEIALDLIRAALAAGRPVAPLTADAGYGDSTRFRDALTGLGLPYLVGIKTGTKVWPLSEGLDPAVPRGRPLTVSEFAAALRLIDRHGLVS
jgi:SRSO17 transposase